METESNGEKQMKMRMSSRRRRSKQKERDEVGELLKKSWYHLRLSVRHPSWVPTWDAIMLTVASPEQARLYDWQLNHAKRMGRISPSTLTLFVPDPDGHRIGSGTATLNTIHALAAHYKDKGGAWISFDFYTRSELPISFEFCDLVFWIWVLDWIWVLVVAVVGMTFLRSGCCFFE